MSKGRGRPKKTNKHKVPLEKVEEIARLDNEALILGASLEYRNWVATTDQKKNDVSISRIKEHIKNINDEIKEDPAYIKADADFKRIKENLVDEELARLKEELKNLNEPFAEDISSFRGLFKTAMDEINDRKLKGLLTFK